MTSQALSMWGNGAVTLPKEWRDQYPTKHFMAVETAEGLLIKPIVDIDYYERDDGAIGLKFPMGIEAGELLKMMKGSPKKTAHPRKK